MSYTIRGLKLYTVKEAATKAHISARLMQKYCQSEAVDCIRNDEGQGMYLIAEEILKSFINKRKRMNNGN
jgi:hypothetical protein